MVYFSTRNLYRRLRSNSQSSHTKDLVDNPSTQLGTQLESEIHETQGLSSQAGICYALNSLGPPTQDPHC